MGGRVVHLRYDAGKNADLSTNPEKEVAFEAGGGGGGTRRWW